MATASIPSCLREHVAGWLPPSMLRDGLLVPVSYAFDAWHHLTGVPVGVRYVERDPGPHGFGLAETCPGLSEDHAAAAAGFGLVVDRSEVMWGNGDRFPAVLRNFEYQDPTNDGFGCVPDPGAGHLEPLLGLDADASAATRARWVDESDLPSPQDSPDLSPWGFASVQAAQQAARRAELVVGPVDGVWGPQTRAAVAVLLARGQVRQEMTDAVQQ